MQVLIGLGGNLGDVSAAFRTALAGLEREWPVAACSRLWRSEPVGPPQPGYLNAAAVLDVDRPLDRVLARCRELEREAGRVAGERWGPRPLDLDLLLAPGVVRRGPELTLPHPLLQRRAFALGPAAEVAGGWLHPLLGRTVAELAAEVLAADPDAARPLEPWR